MTTPVTIQRIMEAACERYGVSIADVIEVAEQEKDKEAEKKSKKLNLQKSKHRNRRKNKAVYAKQAIYFLSVRYLIYAPKLWQSLGDKDHTGISKAFKKVYWCMMTDRTTWGEITDIIALSGLEDTVADGEVAMMTEQEELLLTLEGESKKKALNNHLDLWAEVIAARRMETRAAVAKEEKEKEKCQLSLFDNQAA